MSHSPPTSSAVAGNEGLQRRLTSRQLTMIAIGGAIGVGLFLGSSFTIELAGPSVIVSYIFGALIAGVVAYALAEMAVVHPVSGSFGVYAEKYLSRWSGFTVRATYGLVQIIAIGAEVTAVGIYFAYWFPHVPAWIWILVVSLALVLMNALQVGNFGEFEYWFALIKVAAIIVFVVAGLSLIFGITGRAATGFGNLTQNGGFFPHGWRGAWLALTLVITSYMGVEVIAITAGEAQDPEKSIPRAMRTIVFRLILFYVLAMTVMLSMTPWDRIANASITGSPFVRAFGAVGIPFAASLMNLVVITAALSSANTNLYTSTRMLFSLARSQQAPAWLGKLSSNAVPHRALIVCTAGMGIAILLAIFNPKGAFLTMYGTAVAGMLFVWIVILFTHLKFRKSLNPAALAALPLKLPAHPLPTLAGIAALGGISLSTFWVEGLKYTVPTFFAFLLVLSAAYWQQQVRERSGHN